MKNLRMSGRSFGNSWTLWVMLKFKKSSLIPSFGPLNLSFLNLFKLCEKTPYKSSFCRRRQKMTKCWYLQLKWENLERRVEILDTREICGLCWTLHGSLVFVFFSKLAFKHLFKCNFCKRKLKKSKLCFMHLSLETLEYWAELLETHKNCELPWVERKCCFPQIPSFAPNKFTNNMYGHALKNVNFHFLQLNLEIIE